MRFGTRKVSKHSNKRRKSTRRKCTRKRRQYSKKFYGGQERTFAPMYNQGVHLSSDNLRSLARGNTIRVNGKVIYPFYPYNQQGNTEYNDGKEKVPTSNFNWDNVPDF